jgi:hypothetical protein
MLAGMLGATPIEQARVRGEDITFTVAGAQYTGRINGNTMQGTVKTAEGERKWSARRAGV